MANERVTRVILDAIAARLRSITIDDPALTSVSFTVHLRAGGGWPRGVTMRLETLDALNGCVAGDPAWDACGPLASRRG